MAASAIPVIRISHSILVWVSGHWQIVCALSVCDRLVFPLFSFHFCWPVRNSNGNSMGAALVRSSISRFPQKLCYYHYRWPLQLIYTSTGVIYFLRRAPHLKGTVQVRTLMKINLLGSQVYLPTVTIHGHTGISIESFDSSPTRSVPIWRSMHRHLFSLNFERRG